MEKPQRNAKMQKKKGPSNPNSRLLTVGLGWAELGAIIIFGWMDQSMARTWLFLAEGKNCGVLLGVVPICTSLMDNNLLCWNLLYIFFFFFVFDIVSTLLYIRCGTVGRAEMREGGMRLSR